MDSGIAGTIYVLLGLSQQRPRALLDEVARERETAELDRSQGRGRSLRVLGRRVARIGTGHDIAHDRTPEST
jgi:hypothetical protein